MAFPFQRCRDVLFDGLLAALDANQDYIRWIKKTNEGVHPASGLDFELVPWHAACHLSLRSIFDPPELEYRDPDAWEHGYFIESHQKSGETLQEAARFIGDLYEASAVEADVRHTGHMIFLAGAEALLDARIAKFLRSLSVEAHVVEDVFPRNSYFRYTVFDSDGTIKANYCEIVLANRIAARMLAHTSPD